MEHVTCNVLVVALVDGNGSSNEQDNMKRCGDAAMFTVTGVVFCCVCLCVRLCDKVH